MNYQDELCTQVAKWNYLKNFYTKEFFNHQVDLNDLSKEDRLEIIKDLKRMNNLTVTECTERLEWLKNGIEVKLYPYQYGQELVWAWDPRGPVIRVGRGSGSLVPIDQRQEVLDHFQRYPDVLFLFQE